MSFVERVIKLAVLNLCISESENSLTLLNILARKRFEKLAAIFATQNPEHTAKTALPNAQPSIYPPFTQTSCITIVSAASLVEISFIKSGNFKSKYNLPFTLLSDESTNMLVDYDVYKEKSMYGKKYMGIVRTTYLINEEGIIIYANDKVKAKEDALNMIKVLDNLK